MQCWEVEYFDSGNPALRPRAMGKKQCYMTYMLLECVLMSHLICSVDQHLLSLQLDMLL